MILYCFLIVFIANETWGFGYDSGSGSACGKPYRTARNREPPCDLGKQGWCTVAGSAYPWHAVRRFILENQGLMKRMYGEERHIAVLRAELMSNDIEQVNYRYSNPENDVYRSEHKRRYAKDSDNPRLLNQDDAILNTKFIYSEEPNLRTNELYTLPHFRQTSTTEMNSVTENNTVVVDPASKNVETNSVYTNFTITFAREAENQTAEDSTEMENTTEAEITTEDDFLTTTDPVTISDDLTTASSSTQNPLPPKQGQLFQEMDQEEKISAAYKLRGVNACPVKEEVVAPFWANNTRGEILALLNLYPFEQYVHWEKCTFEHRQMYCREGCRCEQQYRLHRLLAYDPNNECRGIFSDWFKFPSCCVCKCYDMPVEFRVTSRSPRTREPAVPEWYRRKTSNYDGENV
ncbi:spatzle 4 [Carabus blaptoides fortunei]